MTVGQCLRHLLDVLAGSWLVKFLSLAFLQTFVHFPAGSILKNQVDFSLVVKISKKTQNMWMSEKRIIECSHVAYNHMMTLPEMRLDLDLSSELVLHLGLDQLGLEEDFQGNNVFALLLSCQIHISEFPLA